MYIRSLQLRNLRVFESLDLELHAPADTAAGGTEALSNVNVFLGDNGSGKSTLLRAIALAALAPVMGSSSGFVPYSLVRRNGQSGRRIASAQVSARLQLHEQDGRVSTRPVASMVELLRGEGFADRIGKVAFPANASKPFWDERSPAFLVLGYGATRRVDSTVTSAQVRRKERLLRYERVASLFEEHATLVPLNGWLPALRQENKGRHTQVVRLINALLPNGQLLPEPIEGEYLFEMEGAQMSFAALSDGYRAYLGWVSDMLYHLCMGCPNGKRLTESQGIVLVDEIDLHLHPAWQRRVVPMLAEALPNLQFFFTSHSPLVAGTVPGKHLYLVETTLRKNGAASAAVKQMPEDVFGMSSDQILSSPLFGTTPTRNETAQTAVNAAAKRAGAGELKGAMELMKLLAYGSTAQKAVSAPMAKPRSAVKRKLASTKAAASRAAVAAKP